MEIDVSKCEVNDNFYYKQLQQLKQENEELREECERLKKLGSYGILQEVKKNRQIEQCLDEIEEIVKNFSCENCKEFSRCLEKRTQSTNLLKVELSYLNPNIEEINKIMQMIPSPTRCDVALEKVILQKIKEVKK